MVKLNKTLRSKTQGFNKFGKDKKFKCFQLKVNFFKENKKMYLQLYLFYFNNNYSKNNIKKTFGLIKYVQYSNSNYL